MTALALFCASSASAQLIAGTSAADFAAARAIMVTRIRETLRSDAPEADDAYFEIALSAVAIVDRERFVPAALRQQAYDPTSLPIGYDQTISDSAVVAIMTGAAHLPPNANVLDVGTGSGYQAAVLSPLSRQVSSIEIIKPLADQATARLRELGYRNVTVRSGDGFAGWPERAPFDAIIVAAGAATMPQPLIDQLKPRGRLIMPIGPTWAQEQLLVVEKQPNGALKRCSLGWTMFVPLTGRGERAPNAAGTFDTKLPSCYARSLIAPLFRTVSPPPKH
ncbi:protein-L-isoaspartate(D-aspartate) O-methyltransferase [Novosphingobium sp. G106]|uniref:protein-L-isoaspartate(D-aspartate) O-methyltransferase n=1 Tax=Novosphingobium sp. G106 TaxID=2849500 RepID=UPI001C2DEECB|nr:protein-L-isoaspartate(D-aspartate) O-methyltransferase [Novosphingobium sp. G106]MBV1692606.1 protein-L-isoaspartate(D-aspartate) O-methyltransferase [Novosphingobium sp. G106]